MSTKLITITPEAEKTMLYIARVSSPDQESKKTGLLGYCLKHGHWSVFEHAHMTIEIETSRAISPQILRHRSFTFSEFSQRYAKVEEAPVLMGARRQDDKNRQNSIDDMSLDDKEWFQACQVDIWWDAQKLYRKALDRGIAKEVARSLLPSMAPTKLYMTGNIRSWIHYINLRCGNGTQLEHQVIAEGCKKIFAEQLPVLTEALEWSIMDE